MRGTILRRYGSSLGAAAVLFGVCILLGRANAQTAWPPVSRAEAIQYAADHLTTVTGLQLGPLKSAIFLENWYPARGATWSVDFDLPDGGTISAGVDAVSGEIWAWDLSPGRYRYMSDSGPRPRLSPDEAIQAAIRFVQGAYPAMSRLQLRSAGRPLACQYTYVVAWNVVVDMAHETLGPTPLVVQIDHQTGDVLGVELPFLPPITVPTRPGIGRAQMLAIARRYALLDPARYPINQIILRVAMDDHGSQRLVWECLQVLGVDPDGGVMMYGVVHDACTGEPLYPIAPFGGGKHSVRQISFPRRCSVLLEPGDKAMTTPLVPPDIRPDGLWVRAEHLRAVDGVRVKVDRNHVSIRAGDRSFAGSDLGAEWRSDGWWVPLRGAAKALGWRVEWDNVKKVAIVHVK